MEDNNKERKSNSPPPVVKSPILEVKEIFEPPSSYIFEKEIQKTRIPMHISDLVKHEDFKRCLSKLFQPEPKSHSTNSVNLQDEKSVVMLWPLIEDRDESLPPLYTSLNIHDKVFHNFLMDSGESHNLMPNIVM
jgi:hypothetical protein